ncbi:MAG: oligosaccharide flippase family protein [Flavobacteriales bacterium]|nr:oligosaccharide flippase family protein [Flavobacteriales bacterium]MCB9446895.1 oligosaccharide flippase family protein [Flavobacteriales bacterium]
MQKKFFSNLLLLLFLNLLIKPFWVLGIDRAVQNEVGPEIYGEYFALFNFSFLFNILLDFGLTNYNNRSIAQNNLLLTKYVARLFVFKLMLGVLFLLVSLVIGLSIDYSADQLKLLIFLIFNQFLISLTLYLRSNIAGLHLFKSDSMISVLDRSLMILFCGLLLLKWVPGVRLTIHTFVYLQTVAYGLTALAALGVVWRRANGLVLKWDWPFVLTVVKKSMPYAILVLLMSFYNRLDTVMLERLLPDGAEQSGIYAAGFRLLDAANMIAMLFAVILLPMFSRMIRMHEPVDEIVTLSVRLLIVPAIMLGLSCYFYRQELMGMLYHNRVDESARVFGVLMFCFVAVSATYIFGTLLTANGNLRQLNGMALLGIVINVGLNLYLIPRMAALGSAYASLITQVFTALAQVIIAQSVFRFKIKWSFLFRLLLFAAGVAVLGYFSTQLPYNWLYSMVGMLVACVLLSYLTGLLSIRMLYRILKYG